MRSLWLPALALFYLLLYQRYRAYEIDNPWFLSFSREYWVNHNGQDLFQNDTFPVGMGGTMVFGRIAALGQAAILNHTGWSPFPATVLSIVIVLAGLYVWRSFLRRHGLSSAECTALVLTLGIAEPFVGMAERFRYEPYSFLLMAVAFWLTTTSWPTAALIVAMAAAEIHPASAIVSACIVLFLIRSGVRLSTVVYGSMTALVCFIVMYTALHPDILTILRHTDWKVVATNRPLGGFVRAYFVDRRRHLPELVVFAASLMVYLRHRAAAPPFVSRMAELAALVCVFSLVVGWPTSAYMVYFFPFALPVSAWCLQRLREPWRRPWVMPFLAGLLVLPQYAALAWINRHEGYSQNDLGTVAVAIAKNERNLGLDDKTAQIMGDYSLWYAHPSHYRALSTKTLSSVPLEDLFLCYDGPLRPVSMVDQTVLYCDSLPRWAAVKQVDALEVRGHLLRFFVPMTPSDKP